MSWKSKQNGVRKKQNKNHTTNQMEAETCRSDRNNAKYNKNKQAKYNTQKRKKCKIKPPEANPGTKKRSKIIKKKAGAKCQHTEALKNYLKNAGGQC